MRAAGPAHHQDSANAADARRIIASQRLFDP
jgi:hypothetical protein